VPFGVDGSAVMHALARAGNNADALRHFNEHISDEMDLRPLLAHLDAATLVIVGELDPFESGAREIADALPNPTLVVAQGADHFPFLEPEHRAGWSRSRHGSGSTAARRRSR